jgi:hypothetical protein
LSVVGNEEFELESSSIIFAANTDLGVPTFRHHDRQVDGATADLAVLYILLKLKGTIHEDTDLLSAIGTLNGYLF